MRCQICNEDVISTDQAEQWGPQFAHSNCVTAFNFGKADATEPLLQRIAELEDSLSAWRRNAELADQANRELERQLEEARKDAELYQFIACACEVFHNGHEIGGKDELIAAMQKGQP